MATIKAIEGRSVHQIQSGQVIVDLNSVVKELVENSLDAGATSIDIRFKNHGLDSIEVQDNGQGIAPEDYETVALKHFTSKLTSFEELSQLDTFGFRGEALSSLCALSRLHIVTARADAGPKGSRLDFELSGKLKSTSVVAAQRGTTVAVEDLFYNLPVRRKELEKNVKREYGKVITLLHAYACISVGVRFYVTNQASKGKKAAVFATQANTTTKENIANVFGAKTLLGLVKLDLHLRMEQNGGSITQMGKARVKQAADQSLDVRVQGHISKPIFGEGRNAPDRQMFFVNSRPCNLPQVNKAVNEVYKSFNLNQNAFVFANLVMDTNAYDVNVSPDKRTIMLHDQAALLESLKDELTKLFEQTDHTVPQSTLPNRKLPSYKPLTVHERPSREHTADNGSVSADSDDSRGESGTSVDTESRPNGISVSGMPLDGTSHVSNDRFTPSSHAHRTTSQEAVDEGDNHMHMQGAPTAKNPDLEMVRKDEAKPKFRSNGTMNLNAFMQRNAVPIPVSEPEDAQMATGNDFPYGSTYSDLFSQQPPSHLHRHTSANSLYQDTHLEEAENLSKDEKLIQSGNSEGEARFPSGAGEDDIPAVETQVETKIAAMQPNFEKATPGHVQNAFDRMRPKRTPLQTAQITIGDHTTTTVIGSDSHFKRRRIHQPVHSQSIARFGCSPRLAQGLRSFAAPGSQMELDSSNIVESSRSLAEAEDGEDAGSELPSSADEGEEEEDEVAISSPVMLSKEKRDCALPSPSPLLSEEMASQSISEPDDEDSTEDYVNEEEKRLLEDEKVARLIRDAEEAAARPTEASTRRALNALKNDTGRKDATFGWSCCVETSLYDIEAQSAQLQAQIENSRHDRQHTPNATAKAVENALDGTDAETKLSLTVNKSDFERMQIVGQFNLGFILAVRPANADHDADELFIIDQHAADEKYNYERLQRTVTLQSQRLVRPKALDLTAVEDELVLNNPDALKANGFEIEVSAAASDADDEPTSRAFRLLTLPISREKTFEIADLEELLHLLSEHPAGSSSSIPRPRKVQRMLAMRACRSSIMVGKTLTLQQMRKVVRHMGEMEKPWNCPHGRPTMRHLATLGNQWDAWLESRGLDTADFDGGAVGRTNWKEWLADRS